MIQLENILSKYREGYSLEEISNGAVVVKFLEKMYDEASKDKVQIIKKGNNIKVFLMNERFVEEFDVKVYQESYSVNNGIYYEDREIKHEFTKQITDKNFFTEIKYLMKEFSNVSLREGYYVNSKDLVHDFGFSYEGEAYIVNNLDIKRFKKLIPGIDILKFTRILNRMLINAELKEQAEKEIKSLEKRNIDIVSNDNFTDYEKQTIIEKNKIRILEIKKEVFIKE